MGLITVESLSRTSVAYDPILRKLPFFTLNEELKKIGANLKGADGEDILFQFQRKNGSSRPYDPNNIGKGTSVGTVIERKMESERSYNAQQDSVLNYEGSKVMSNTAEPVDEKTKKHPLEYLMIESILRNTSDDILSACFLGVRDTTNQTPIGMVDGWFTKLAQDIVAGEVAAGKGNLITTGAITDPGTGTDAYDQVVEFLLAMNNMLRYNGGNLYMTDTTKFYAKKGLRNLFAGNFLVKDSEFIEILKDQTGISNLNIITHPAMGSGSQLMFTKPGILDFGMDNSGGSKFVQIRQINEDPNIMDFWTQWKMGTRIASVHQKEFACNEQTNTSPMNFGDIS